MFISEISAQKHSIIAISQICWTPKKHETHEIRNPSELYCKCTGLFVVVTHEILLCFLVGSTLSLCLQDGSNCRQRSLLCLWPCLFRNSFHRTESTHHGPKLYTWKERRFVSKEHPKVSNGMLTEFPDYSIYRFQSLLHEFSRYMNHETWYIILQNN